MGFYGNIQSQKGNRKKTEFPQKGKKKMEKILTLENAKQFIEDCNLQEEFKNWIADTDETDLDYLTLDFAEASYEFEKWAKENLDYEEEEDEGDETDCWDDDTTSYDEVEKDRRALAWEFNRR